MSSGVPTRKAGPFLFAACCRAPSFCLSEHRALEPPWVHSIVFHAGDPLSWELGVLPSAGSHAFLGLLCLGHAVFPRLSLTLS